MDREPERANEPIELGTASTATQGGVGLPIDERQQQPASGLSDD